MVKRNNKYKIKIKTRLIEEDIDGRVFSFNFAIGTVDDLGVRCLQEATNVFLCYVSGWVHFPLEDKWLCIINVLYNFYGPLDAIRVLTDGTHFNSDAVGLMHVLARRWCCFYFCYTIRRFTGSFPCCCF